MPKKNNGPRLDLNEAGVWEIRWTENRRSYRKSTGTADKTEAQAALGRHLLGLASKSAVSEAGVSRVLDLYFEEHVSQKVVDTSRQADCLAVLRSGLGHLDVQQLTPDAIAEYCKARRNGAVNGRKVVDGTLRRELNCLVAAVNHAVRHRRIPQSEAPHIALPPAAPPKDLWLTEAQLDLLLEKAATLYQGERLSRIHRFAVLAAETAARKTSILTLRWNQVDLDARLIHFQNDGLARTKKRRVPVPMSDDVHALLERASDERQSEWVMDTPHSIQHHFDALVRACGDGFEKVTPHTLRHTWATHAARAGVPLFEIAGVLGDTLQTVMRVYAHHCPDHLRGAVNFRARPARNADKLMPTITNTST